MGKLERRRLVDVRPTIPSATEVAERSMQTLQTYKIGELDPLQEMNGERPIHASYSVLSLLYHL